MNNDDLRQEQRGDAAGSPAGEHPLFSAHSGPVDELLAQGVLSGPSHPGLLGQLDRFEILREIGRGGMGIVLLARDTATQQKVALKLLRPELARDPKLAKRFLSEADTLRQLSHPFLLPVHEVCARESGPYFVMPFYPRGSLSSQLRAGEPLPSDQALDYAMQLAEALRFIHSKWLFHRDVKPGNILIAEDGKVKLADFGLARPLFNDASAASQQIRPEGTAPYMSPLLAAGEAEDTRSDIYAFGAVLYELLTGHPPYRGETSREILEKIQAGPPEPIQKLNPKAHQGLTLIAETALQREQSDRYANMADILAALRRVKHGDAPGHRPRRFRPQPGSPATRRLLIGTGTALLLAGMLALGHYAKPKLKVVGTIPVPELADCLSWARPADWDGDGKTDVIFLKGTALQVVLHDGARARLLQPRGPANVFVTFFFACDINGDGLDEPFISWCNETNDTETATVCLGAVDRNGFTVKNFQFCGTVTHDKDWGIETSSLRPLRVLDIDGDGNLELLAEIDTGWGKHPRGLCCFDVKSEKLKWFFPTAPYVRSIECADVNADGQLEILMGSISFCNGNAVTNGPDPAITDDSHSYFYLLSANGRCLWRHTCGGSYSRVSPIPAQGALSNQVLVLAASPPVEDRSIGEPSFGTVMSFDSQGKLLKTFVAQAPLCSGMATDLGRPGRPQVLVTDKLGRLQALNADLSPHGPPITLATNTGTYVQLGLLGAVRLPGEPAPYIVLTSYQLRQSEEGLLLGRTGKNSRRIVWDNYQLMILDSDLKPVARHRVKDRVLDGIGRFVSFFLLNTNSPPQFLALGKDIEFLEFRRW